MLSTAVLVGIIGFLVLLVAFLLFKQYKQKRDMEMQLLKQQANLSQLEIGMHELAQKNLTSTKTRC